MGSPAKSRLELSRVGPSNLFIVDDYVYTFHEEIAVVVVSLNELNNVLSPHDILSLTISNTT